MQRGPTEESLTEASVSPLERLAGAPTDDDWRWPLDLYQPLIGARTLSDELLAFSLTVPTATS
jgi:hypothetical protein